MFRTNIINSHFISVNLAIFDLIDEKRVIAPELVPYAEFSDLSRHHAFNYVIFNAVVT